MNKTKHKPRLDAQFNEHGAVEHKGKWANFVLACGSGSFLCEYRYDSCAQARNYISELRGNSGFIGIYGVNDALLAWEDIAAVIQIPVKS